MPTYGPAWLARLDALTYGGEDVAVAFALKESSPAVSVINVGGLHQHQPSSYLYYQTDGVDWPTVRPLSFHNLRWAGVMHSLFWCTFAYRPKGRAGELKGAQGVSKGPQELEKPLEDEPRPRCFVPSAEAFVRRLGCTSFLPGDDPSCVEPRPNRTLTNRHSVIGLARAQQQRENRALLLARAAERARQRRGNPALVHGASVKRPHV